jgi:nucleoside-diphosphate-sugar epimerase
MRIAVVGSSGFIGRHLCDALAGRGSEVVAISSTAAAFDDRTGVLTDDLPSPGSLDAMVYLSQSPYYRDVPRQAPHLWGVNVISAVKAANWARLAGARRIVHASTGNVYAPSFIAHSESDPTRKDDWYALSKLHAEEALRLLPDVSVTSLRLFGVYGPRQRAKLIPNLVGKIRNGECVRLQRHPDDGKDADGLRLSLTHVDDVVRVMVHLLEAGGPPVMNVAGPGAFSIRDIAIALGGQVGIEPRFEIDAAPRAFNLIADNSLVATLVGGGFTSFASGIGPTVEELLC